MIRLAIASIMSLAALFSAIICCRAYANQPDDFDLEALRSRLNSLTYSTTQADIYADPDALQLAGEALINRTREIHGDPSGETANALAEVASAFKSNNQFSIAAEYYRNAVETWDKSGQPDNFPLPKILAQWQVVLHSAKRPDEEAVVLRWLYPLTLKAKGASSREAELVVRELVSALVAAGDFKQANRWLETGLRDIAGEKNPDTSTLMSLLNTYALQQEASGNDAAAEDLFLRALPLETARLKSENFEDRDETWHLRNEPRIRGNLADFYESRARFDAAEKALKDERDFMISLAGPKSEAMIPSLLRLADFYTRRKIREPAIDAVRKVLAINRVKDDYYIEMKRRIGLIEIAVGRYGAAISALEALLAEARHLKEADDRLVSQVDVLPHLAVAYRLFGRPEDALQTANDCLKLIEKYGSKVDDTQGGITFLLAIQKGHAYIALGQYDAAQKEIASATSFAKEVNLTGMKRRDDGRASSAPSDDEINDELLALLFKFYEAAPAWRPQTAALGLELSQTLRVTSAERAIGQLAQRAKVGGDLGALVRDQQDFQQRREAIARRLAALRGQAAKTTVASGSEEKSLSDRIVKLDAALVEIDRDIAGRQSKRLALLQPSVVSATELQGLIGDGELIVRIAAGPAFIDVWLVDKSNIRWRRVGLTSAQLSERVRVLRCGLDSMAWSDAGDDWCRNMLGPIVALDQAGDGKLLPFDLSRAYELYTKIFGADEDLLKTGDGAWRQLLVVAPGALSTVPFQVLVTTPPAVKFGENAEDFQRIAWFGRRHAIAVLPSLGSLKSLRVDLRASAAPKPYIGFGNPLLDGRASNRNNQAMKQLAAAWQTCATTDLAGKCLAAFPRLVSGDGQKTNMIRELSPLPQTACELCAVGARFDETRSDQDIRLGSRATKAEVMRLGTIDAGTGHSALEQYRIVHFATHGALESRGYAEPGLILTPGSGAQDNDEDDGYLAASDVVGLKLDADWVILSACNTAAGSRQDAEAFSGLARAFFFSGARALLVSNWGVYTNAAVDLTTRTIKRYGERDGAVGRAEALRASLESMIQDAARDKNIHRLHPSYWGAFSIVGENR